MLFSFPLALTGTHTGRGRLGRSSKNYTGGRCRGLLPPPNATVPLQPPCYASVQDLPFWICDDSSLAIQIWPLFVIQTFTFAPFFLLLRLSFHRMCHVSRHVYPCVPMANPAAVNCVPDVSVATFPQRALVSRHIRLPGGIIDTSLPVMRRHFCRSLQ